MKGFLLLASCHFRLIPNTTARYRRVRLTVTGWFELKYSGGKCVLVFYATCNSQPTTRRTTLVSDYVIASEQVRHFLAPPVLTLITSSHPLHHHMCFYPPFLEVSLPSYDTHHFDHHTAARRLCRSLIPPLVITRLRRRAGRGQQASRRIPVARKISSFSLSLSLSRFPLFSSVPFAAF